MIRFNDPRTLAKKMKGRRWHSQRGEHGRLVWKQRNLTGDPTGRIAWLGTSFA